MRLTVFHIDGEKVLRGGQRQMLYLAEHLRRKNHENIIVCRKGSPLDSAAQSLRFRTHHLPFFNEWDPVSAWKLRRELRRFARPIVHAHTSHAAALAFLATRGTDAVRIVHRRVDFPVHDCLGFRIKYSSADGIVAISKAIQNLLARAMRHGAAEKIEVIPSAANPQAGPLLDKQESRRLLCKQCRIPIEGTWVGNVAALVPHKDQATLIRAMPEVLFQIPDTRLFLVGEGPERAGLERLRHQLGLDDRILFLGLRSDVPEILCALDLFVLSSWGEGMGSVLLEAMNFKTPVVGTAAGGIPEVVLDGRTGLLVPPREPHLLAEAMLKLLKDRPLAWEFARQGYERLQEFTAEKMGDRTLAVYESLMRRAETAFPHR